MRLRDGSLWLSSGDLVGFVQCRRLAVLDRAVAEGTLASPAAWDPALEILQQRGFDHEQAYLDALAARGVGVLRIDGVGVSDDVVARTIDAMQQGVEVIAQGALAAQNWLGRPDVLRRVDVPSSLGPWSYEAFDTKLARETRGGAILQLCVYSDLLSHAQGIAPEHLHIVAPWSDFQPKTFPFADYAAYYRRVKASFEQSLQVENDAYPEPKEHCEVCRWRDVCAQRRREDDHLSLVAGITKVQIAELRRHDVRTVRGLSEEPVPLRWKPDRGSPHSYARIREQARLQIEARDSGQRKFELLPIEPRVGLARLPVPSEGDIFLDFEGDPFVGEHGLEYLIGWAARDDGELLYRGLWSMTREHEKNALQTFVDFVMQRWEAHPGMHIYHFAPYEPAAIKRLMTRYGTRQEEVDRMLRAKLFVDLFDVARHSLRASVESYSIKRLEPFFGFERRVSLQQANSALLKLSRALELAESPSIPEEVRAAVEEYNQDDCLATASLHAWLEALREQQVSNGVDIPRFDSLDGAANDNVTAWVAHIQALEARLTVDVPADPTERNVEQQARWLLAHILDWHRREDKPKWWDYFRLSELLPDDLFDERSGISGLTFEGTVGGTALAPIHRYRYALQNTDVRDEADLMLPGGEPFGKVEDIWPETLTVDIKKRKDTAGIHPPAVFAHTMIKGGVLANALVRIGERVADGGMQGDGSYLVARDLLLRERSRVPQGLLRFPGEAALDAAIRLAQTLESGVLPIQGPPGSGKTYTGARMICEFVRRGMKVGVTANSHKVIRNMLDAVYRASTALGIAVRCCQKVKCVAPALPWLSFETNNSNMDNAVSVADVAGATAWYWARAQAEEIVDVLVVDEAAQMSLANVLAISHAAKALILVGDPQQLDQPTQGTHPVGCEVSALDHVLGGEATIPTDRGLFLEDTWRLHPSICAFTSELFYEGKLRARPDLANQAIRSAGPVQGFGLRYCPVEHVGNQSWSTQEARAVRALVSSILDAGSTWIDSAGTQHQITLDDIVIITPYNAQVYEILRVLPNARVGTVDKFQGQEAPISIYSTATSTHSDAPRGMEFLYSLNRLNVATSRARCLSIVVSSPRLLEAECRTPRQMQLANAFCRFVELAHTFAPGDFQSDSLTPLAAT